MLGSVQGCFGGEKWASLTNLDRKKSKRVELVPLGPERGDIYVF